MTTTMMRIQSQVAMSILSVGTISNVPPGTSYCQREPTLVRPLQTFSPETRRDPGRWRRIGTHAT
jgi:hypothetical protein